MHPNYPNPFNPETQLVFELPQEGMAELTIYDLLGRKIKTLVWENLPAGRYEIIWEGTDESGQTVASGVYLYRLTVGQAFSLSN